MQRDIQLFPSTPPVCRLGLATRGNTELASDDIWAALERGVNYWNWCGHEDGMSTAVRELGRLRQEVVVATQLYERDAEGLRRELEETLEALGTDYLDVATFYYLETEAEWDELAEEEGGLDALEQAGAEGLVRAWGPTSHQRRLARQLAESGRVHLVMIRYNAAHRGAEKEIFPTTDRLEVPVIAYTAVRWGALLRATPEDPPDARIPTAVDAYRYTLSHPSVAVTLMAPDGPEELAQNLALLDDWRGVTDEERDEIEVHGSRVYRTAGSFP